MLTDISNTFVSIADEKARFSSNQVMRADQIANDIASLLTQITSTLKSERRLRPREPGQVTSWHMHPAPDHPRH